MNPYEMVAREAKADRLYRELTKIGATPELVEAMTDKHWQDVAKVVGVKAPSEKTIERVKYLFRLMSAPQGDPFEGLEE